jgi:hypothetical protein
MAGSSSDDDDDEGGGGIVGAMRARQAAAALAAPPPGGRAHERSPRLAASSSGAAPRATGGTLSGGGAAVAERLSRPAPRPNLPDSSDESDGGIAEAMRRALRERRAREVEEAEGQLAREMETRRLGRNPMGVERREREERERRWRERRTGTTDGGGGGEEEEMAQTRAGAGGLEGTEILVGGEDAEAKSVSEMGDENRDARGGGGGGGGRRAGSGAADDAAVVGGERPPHRRPSRGACKRPGTGMNRGVDDGEGDDDVDDDDDSPSKKRRTGGRRSFRNQGGGTGDPDDDGLWDDSDADRRDEKRKVDSDDGDSDDGDRRKRGRSKQRGSTGPSQPRKRSGSSKAASNAPSKAAGGSDDDSSILPNQNIKEPSLKNGRRRCSATAHSDNDIAEPKKPSSSGGNRNRWASRYEIDEDEKCDHSDDEVDRRARQLKPDFSDPKMGAPGPLVPFTLSKNWERGDRLIGYEEGGDTEEGEDARKMPAPIANDDDIEQVPASINRYLKGYQRMGVQFMYSSVIHGKGCVLGDDMGLGKTVQVISLIAALLKKTGNGLDALEIKQHNNKLKKVLQAREDSKRQALLTGFGITSEIETAELPRFTPILIIVPSSVVENWQVRQCVYLRFMLPKVFSHHD